GTKGLGIDRRSKLHRRIAGGRQAEREQGRLGHKFHAGGKFVVKVAHANTSPSVPKLLINTSVIGARGLWANRIDAVLLDQLAAVGRSGQDVIERDALVIDARLFNAFTKTEIQLGSAEE